MTRKTLYRLNAGWALDQIFSGGTNTPYVIDDGLGTNNGAEPTGYTTYSSLSGGDVVARAAAAGVNVMSMGPGTFTLPGFTSVTTATQIASTGIIGAGTTQTTLSQVPNSSSGATTGNYLIRFTNPNGLLEDLTIVGTTQTTDPFNIHGGLIVNADNWTLRRLKLVGIAPGNNSAPPGETFGISFFKAYGNVLIEDVEIDGQGVGASNLGTNGSGTDATMPSTFLTVNRLYTHGNRYSGGLAFWQTKFDPRSVMNDCVFDDSRCFWNVERCSGTITLNRPRIGRLNAMPSGTWDTSIYGSPNGSIKSTPSATGVFAESDTTWGSQASQDFRFIVRDPRNLDGTPYTGPKLGVTFGSANDKGTNYYGRTNFKCYDAGGTDISTAFFSYGGNPFN